MKEIEDGLDRGELNPQNQYKLDQNFKYIIGDEEYNKYRQWVRTIEDKLTKSELVETLEGIKSKDKSVEKPKISKLTLSDIYNKLIYLLTLIKKLTIISLILKLLSKVKFIRIVWVGFNSFIAFIFGLAYSDVYDFKDLFDMVTNSYYQVVESLHKSKLFKLLVKILKSTKDLDDSPVLPKEEIKVTPKEVPKQETTILHKEDSVTEKPYTQKDFSRWHTEDKKWKSYDIENNRRNIENTTKVDGSFIERNFWAIAISVISLSLIYYYWDNITDLSSNIIEKLKI